METNSNQQLNDIVKGMTIFFGSMIAVVGLASCLWLSSLVLRLPAFAPLVAQIARMPWHLSRATGIVAYLLLTGSVAWGLILSTKIIKTMTPPPFSLGMHAFVSWAAIVLTAVHGGLLLLDGYYQFSLANLLIPFTGPYMPLWVGLGIVSLYLMVLVSASFSWKKWLTHKNWRRLHYLSFPAYGLVTLHGLMAGTDSANLGMQAMFVGSTAIVLFLTNYRILTGRRSHTSAQNKHGGRINPDRTAEQSGK